MRFFRDLPLDLKFTIIAVLTSGVSLLIACGAFAIYDHAAFRGSLARDFNTITDIFDDNVTSGLAFNDVDSLEKTLGTLVDDPRIVVAAVYDKSGNRVASFVRPGARRNTGFPLAPVEGQKFGADRIDTVRSVDLAGETIGTVYIGAGLAELHDRALRNAAITLVLLVGCSFVALLLASRLRRIVSGPVIELAATADRVAVTRDFSLRAPKHGDDEVGRLVEGFNNMLSQIQTRDDQLQAAHDKLEQRVNDRTAALVREIRERTEAEAALARSHSVINATLESTIDGLMVIDNDGRVKHFNRRFAEIWNVDPALLTSGRHGALLRFIARQLREPRRFVRRSRTIYSDPVNECSDTIEFKDGRIVELYTRPQQSDGVSAGRVWSVRDITERKRIEAEVIYERDLLQVLMDTVPDILYFKDLDSRLVRVSRSKVEETLAIMREFHLDGRQPEDAAPFPPHLESAEALRPWLLGKTDLETFDPGSASQMFSEEAQIIHTGEPVTGKLESLKVPSGRSFWYLASKMPWRDPSGRIIGTYGISKNITAIKEAEEEIRLVHEQLVKASRQAGMAEVATGVLHNVGNVLNSVNVSAGILRETLRGSEISTLVRVAGLLRDNTVDIDAFLTRSPKGRLLPGVVIQLAEQLAREHATLVAEQEHLVRNVEHIKSIVAMQQSYAKVSGVHEKVRLAELMRDVLQMHSNGFTRHNIEVVREYEDLPEMVIDRHKVMQILVNLVTNARHAIKEARRSDGRITVRVAQASGGRARVTIADNGVGIPAENLKRIFSHGFTTRTNGHGFGLHSGANAAREMGGSLHVESAGIGSGAAFTLEFPIKRTETPK